MKNKLSNFFKKLNDKHKSWYKNNSYYYSKLLIRSFFIISIILFGIVVFVDGIESKVWVSCPESSMPCDNPLKELGCDDMCCQIDFLAPGQSCGEPTSWLGKNYSWLVFLLFVIVLLINHFVFNKNYDFNKYWGDFK